MKPTVPVVTPAPDLLWAAIIDSSDDAIVSKDLNGTITSWNRAAERIFGYTADEIVGRPVTVLIPRDRLDEEPRIIERLKRGERVDHFETVRVRKDGTKIDLSLTISPIKDRDGTVVGASKIARDISLQAQVKRDLARANDELKRADRVKTEFLAIMSHELRTPLNSILGFTGVVLRRLAGPLTEEQEKQLRMVHGSATHLLHLINDVLDLSRIESGHVEIHAEDFPPAETIARAIRTVEVTARQKGLALVAELPALPEIRGDEQKFLQILLNLLGNAVKFTHEGRITVTSRVTGGMIVTSVADTGIGIPADKQGILFQPFQQVEGSSRRRYEGTGLGLYLCKKLVTLMGGQIALVSTPGRGSTFTFSLPVALEARTVVAEPAVVSA
jgi:PAS domain S-box-containing protein